LRTVRFTLRSGDGEEVQQNVGSVAALLRSLPYALSAGLLPPAHVLNSVLRAGFSDGGLNGSCEWPPFELSDEEWRELENGLSRDDGIGDVVAYVAPPNWVKTPSDWHVWAMSYRHGVPVEEHRRLLTVYEDIEAERRAARARGDEAGALALYSAAFDAAGNLAGFLVGALQRKR
jgi:hypothetical protein